MRPPHNNNNNRRQRGGRPHGNGGSNGGNGGGGNNNGGNNRNRPQQNLRNQIFDSHGPGGERVRGNAFQAYEKYLSLARDAEERIDQENYYQHAEHYYRIIEAIQDMEAEQRSRFTVVESADPFAPGANGEQPDMNQPGMGDQPMAEDGQQQQRQPQQQRYQQRPYRQNQQQPQGDTAGNGFAPESSSPSFSLRDDAAPAEAAGGSDDVTAEAPRARRTRRPAAESTTDSAE